jgi:hypothetical protein
MRKPRGCCAACWKSKARQHGKLGDRNFALAVMSLTAQKKAPLLGAFDFFIILRCLPPPTTFSFWNVWLNRLLNGNGQ